MYFDINRRRLWHDVPSVPPADPLYTWLTGRGSLTDRLCSICKEFRIVVHQSRFDQVCPDETFLLVAGKGAQGTRTLVRDVSLICDGSPLVFGHSILMTRKSGPLALSFRQVGNHSLGSMLFACPGIQRGPIHFKRINRLHALFAKSAAVLGCDPGSFFLARRSVFSLLAEQVCVTEVFSPRLIAASRPQLMR